MAITREQLVKILPLSGKRADAMLPGLNEAMDKYQINTRLRIAAFIAQVGHESGQFVYLKELGNDAYLEKYDVGPIAKRLGNTPADDGDGQKYRGRGLIQITGYANYLACSNGMFADTRLIQTPELLEQPRYAALSAAWFWNSRKLNDFADASAFETITRRINGGVNGLAERKEFYNRALKVLA